MAEPDPRDYVLLPMEDLFEESEIPEFRRADPHNYYKYKYKYPRRYLAAPSEADSPMFRSEAEEVNTFNC